MIKDYLNKFSLKNKKVFIIGGCGLIGSEICEAMISASAELFIFDNNKKKGNLLSKKYNRKKFNFNYFDFLDLKKGDKKMTFFFKKFGCPDIFINCSYPTTKDWELSSFKDNSLSRLRKNIDIHLNSHTWFSYRACEVMKKKKIKGSVIMFSSIYGLVGQNNSIYEKTNIKENMNYSIIKGGIINFSKQLASYYGKYQIRINTICPGGLIGHTKGKSKTQDKTFLRNYIKNCPLKRLGKAEEVASAVLFLGSDASSYVTGTSFIVDGGWTAI